MILILTIHSCKDLPYENPTMLMYFDNGVSLPVTLNEEYISINHTDFNGYWDGDKFYSEKVVFEYSKTRYGIILKMCERNACRTMKTKNCKI